LKRVICIIFALLVFTSISVTAFADTFVMPAEAGNVSMSENGDRAEETVWYTRCYNGLLQKRLWSLTYGYWLTDWITVGTC